MADRYWIGGTGTWNTTSTTNWSTSSGGSSGASVPTAADNVIFDSGSGTDPTITLTGALTCLDITVSATTFTFTSTGTLAVSGSMSLASGTVWNATGTITFNATSSKTISTNGTTISASMTFNGIGGTWALQNALTLSSTRTVTLTNGTIDLTNSGAGNYTLTAGIFSSDNSNTRAITFGTSGQIIVSGSGAIVWAYNTITNFSYSGTSYVELNYSGSTGTRTLRHGSTAGATESNAISFKFTGSATDSLNVGVQAKDFDLSGFGSGGSGAITTSLTNYFYGNVTFSANMTSLTASVQWIFAATSGTQLLTTNGLTLNLPFTQNNPGATLRLEDNCTSGSTRAYTFTAGTLNTNGKTLTFGTFVNTGTNTRSITFNGGTISLSGSGSTVWNASGSGFTTSAGTGNGVISLTSASAKTFVGGGYTYAAALNQGGAGALTVTGSNTFHDITATSVPSTITFTAGTTQTVTQFTASGTSGNLLTLDSSTPGSGYTLFDTSGTTNISYCSIKDSIATGNAFWGAYISNGNLNAGNNFGWRFSPVNQSSGFLSF